MGAVVDHFVCGVKRDGTGVRVCVSDRLVNGLGTRMREGGELVISLVSMRVAVVS